jgi:putative endonuclease
VRGIASVIKIMYNVYILECADKTLYTGITTDLKRRVGEHNNSSLGAKYTCARRPVSLVWSKRFKNRASASVEERRIKKMTRAEKLFLIKT